MSIYYKAIFSRWDWERIAAIARATGPVDLIGMPIDHREPGHHDWTASLCQVARKWGLRVELRDDGKVYAIADEAAPPDA